MSKDVRPSSLIESMIQGLTDWNGMAKLVDAFGDPLVAATVIICGFFTCFGVIVAVCAMYFDHRASERRSEERQLKLKASNELYIKTVDKQSKQKQRR